VVEHLARVAFFSTAARCVSYDIDNRRSEQLLPRLAITGDAAAWYTSRLSPDDRQAPLVL